MKGFSLIETLVTVTIITTLAAVSVETIINFQQQSLVDSSAKELVATLRSAQGKSRSGELGLGETASDFATDGLPVYGVAISNPTYDLVKKFTPFGGAQTETAIESHKVSSGVTISPSPLSFYFSRVNGVPNAAGSLTVQKGTNTKARTVSILDNGLINYE